MTQSINRLPALTLWRPWPWAIMRGSKDVENRNWAPPKSLVGRYLAIHAGKRFDRSAVDFASLAAGVPCPSDESDHPLGVIGIVRVLGWVHRGGEAIGETGVLDLHWHLAYRDDKTIESHARLTLSSPWFVGVYGWMLGDPIEIESPIPCNGRQGLWSLEQEVFEQMLCDQRVRKALEGQR